MFQGKMKAITFSYDDGVTQDRRLVDLLNRYGLKATFNINSDLLGTVHTITNGRVTVDHSKIARSELNSLYKGHEVAVHTLTHPNLTTLPDEEIIHQVEQDRLALSELAGYEVIGMAYPCGGVNNNDHVAEVIRQNTGVKFSRTITSSYSFDPQTNLYRFNPTVFHLEEGINDLCKQFLESEFDSPKLLYIWGHSYEFDYNNTWEQFEELCKLLSGRDDIFYGTNKEVFGL